jgi:hypothetical protein
MHNSVGALEVCIGVCPTIAIEAMEGINDPLPQSPPEPQQQVAASHRTIN